MDDDISHDVGPINTVIPFSIKVSPGLDRARPRHLKWAVELGLLSDKSIRVSHEAADFPAFVARTFPWANGPELDLLTDFLGWS
jgi:hypothetical protein